MFLKENTSEHPYFTYIFLILDSEPILLLVLAYAAYVSAEIFEWSGVVSIICCGLVSVAVDKHKKSQF